MRTERQEWVVLQDGQSNVSEDPWTKNPSVTGDFLKCPHHSRQAKLPPFPAHSVALAPRATAASRERTGNPASSKSSASRFVSVVPAAPAGPAPEQNTHLYC